MPESNAEKLARALQAQLEQSTPEEIVRFLFDLATMRDQYTSVELYRSVFKAAAERLYLKTLTGKW